MQNLTGLILVLSVLAFPANAWDEKDSFGPATEDTLEPIAVREGTETSQGPQSAPDANENWQPKLHVTLTLTEDGNPRCVQAKKRIPYYVTATEEVGVTRSDGNTVKERVAVRKLRFREELAMECSAGLAAMACDDVSFSITSSENGRQSYMLKCGQRARLIIAGLQIDCESLELKNGVMSVTNASVEREGITVTAASMDIAINVLGVSAKKFDRPVEELTLVPYRPGTVPRFDGDFTDADSGLRPRPDPDFSSRFEPQDGFSDAPSPFPQETGTLSDSPPTPRGFDDVQRTPESYKSN